MIVASFMLLILAPEHTRSSTPGFFADCCDPIPQFMCHSLLKLCSLKFQLLCSYYLQLNYSLLIHTTALIV